MDSMLQYGLRFRPLALALLLTLTLSAHSATIYGVGHDCSGNTGYEFGSTICLSQQDNDYERVWLLGPSGYGVVDFQQSVTITNVMLSQYPDESFPTRPVRNVEFYMSNDTNNWGSAVGSATDIPNNALNLSIPLTGASGRYLKVNVLSNWGAPASSSLWKLGYDGPVGTVITPASTTNPTPSTQMLAYTPQDVCTDPDVSALTNGVKYAPTWTGYVAGQWTAVVAPHFWTTLTLAGGVQKVGYLAIWNGGDGNVRDWRVLLVQTSKDGGATWSSVGFYSLAMGVNNDPSNPMQLITLPAGTQADVIRLFPIDCFGGLMNMGWVLQEIEVYEAPIILRGTLVWFK